VATVAAARGAGWGVGTDPVAALVLLIQAAVPPAQTFVIMALASGDADLASRLASLIVRLYAWSAVPMSLAAIGAARWVGAG
jgi:predicted permease